MINLIIGYRWVYFKYPVIYQYISINIVLYIIKLRILNREESTFMRRKFEVKIAVWLATAIMSYEKYKEVKKEREPQLKDFYFR